MEVTGKITRKVEVDPIEVLANLKIAAVGVGGYVDKEDGIFYQYNTSVCGGDDRETISKEKYKYVKAIDLIVIRLKNNG